MKKISLTLVAVLMLCIVALGGCAKADSATLKDDFIAYQNLTTDYSAGDKYLFVDNDNIVDLSSQTAYNEYAYNAILNEQGNFALLRYNKQYQILISSALSFYNNYDTYLNPTLDNFENVVPQTQKSQLYRAIDALRSNCSDIINTKKALVTLCYDGFNIDNINVLHNMERFIDSYKNFIGDAIEVSVAMEEIYSQNMIVAVENDIPVGEEKRLFESAKLYLTKYVYLQCIKYQDAFYDCGGQISYINLMKLIIRKNYSLNDNVEVYNYLVDKLNNLKTGIKNFEVAKAYCENADQTAEGFASHPYKVFVDGFEQQVLDFANAIQNTLLA